MDTRLVILLVVLLISMLCGVIFFYLPNEVKIRSIKEFLKWAVAEAEKELGGGTGQLKLRWVYEKAVDRYPWVGVFISFKTFSAWVDEALNWLNEQLDQNAAIKDYVNKRE